MLSKSKRWQIIASFIVKSLLASALLCTLPACYIVKQGYHQFKLMDEMRPFREVLSDPNIPVKIKQKIRLVKRIKRFAIQELGLKKTGSYTHFIYIKNRFVAYNLTAAPKDRLKPITWEFPIIGRVPYLGFFEKKDALKVEEMLSKRGFDTRIRGIPAYSTMGFLGDPLLSTIAFYPDPVLINIVIHEMTHETIFIKNHTKFNEALATFIGNQGTLLFLEKHYGRKSKWIQFVKDSNHDKLLFSSFIKLFVNELNRFYRSSIPRKTKIKDREKIFIKYQKLFTKQILSKLKTRAYKGFPKLKLDNTLILYFRRYYHNLTLFKKVYLHFHKDMRKTIRFFKRIEKIKANPERLITLWLKAQRNK